MSAPGFPDLAKLLAAHQVPDGEAYPLSKELLLLWTMRAAHQPLFKDRGLRVNAVSPGPVATPILKEFRQIFGDPRVDDDIARVGRAGSAPDIAPAVLFLCSDARALDQRRQSAGRRRPRSLDQRDRSRILTNAAHERRRMKRREVTMKVDFIIDGASSRGRFRTQPLSVTIR